MPVKTPSVTLSILAGPHAGECQTFDCYNTLVVGRGADANWRLAKDPYFSRYHFRIETNPPQCLLIDLESSNGTLVNGKRINQIDLHHGDRITCGDTVFEITII